MRTVLPTTADFPAIADLRDEVQPVPRRLRGVVAGVTVFDTVEAVYAWDTPKYPHYLVPLADVARGHLVDEGRDQRLRRGDVRVHGLRVGDTTIPSAARLYDAGSGPVTDLVRFDWDALEWFEEDEQVFGHPRNPYTRVDALRSSRHVRVELGDVLLAESRSPVLVFETGLPTRYYLDRSDLDLRFLRRTDTRTVCPYKGETSDYWTAEVPGRVEVDVAWSYRQPFAALAPIAGLVAFYDDRVDLTVDGVPARARGGRLGELTAHGVRRLRSPATTTQATVRAASTSHPMT
ncbi:MAG TPA: DUF427 domain-containing protein [Nocardioides sp.]|uniref:DUF427 domain-containing protein n=1 Tax=Nocardioides sp. TaxID=35761 RepID=UPI002E3777F3|nr:DUF427 domain-containing protein [Nocardioides sp.]HEX5087609.1 DUF427 domain-containing protein [Nocardioides sp.]